MLWISENMTHVLTALSIVVNYTLLVLHMPHLLTYNHSFVTKHTSKFGVK